jgi:hypothetical protein
MADDPVKMLRDALAYGDIRRSQLKPLDDASRGIFEPPFYPSDGQSTIEREYRQLVSRAELPILGMVIRAVADRLIVDGVSGSNEEPMMELWDWWQKSRLDSQQGQIISDSLLFGDGYLSITPNGDAPLFMPESPLLLAVQNDPLNPMGVKAAAKQVENRAWLYTDEAIYAFEKDNRPNQWEVVEVTPHPLGVCPIVRFPNRLDSTGRSESEILECLPIQRRINQTIMTRLLLEASAAWRQRWVSGIDVDHDENNEPIPPFRVGVDKLLVAPDPESKFGEFQASSTQDLMAAVEQDLRHIAVITQIPPTMLGTTSISNISSESLAALEGSLTRKIAIKQEQLGESFEYAMTLGGRMIGTEVPYDIEMSWKDLEISSLSQQSNAFTQLKGSGLPFEYLLESVLNLTPQTVERVMKMYEKEQATLVQQEAAKMGGAQAAQEIGSREPRPGQIAQTGEPFLRGNGGTQN